MKRNFSWAKIVFALWFFIISISAISFRHDYHFSSSVSSKTKNAIDSTRDYYDKFAEDYTDYNSKRLTETTQRVISLHRKTFFYLIKNSHHCCYDVDDTNTTTATENELPSTTHKQPRRQKSNGKILDLGCGYGRDVQIFAQKMSFQVLGIDLSRSMLKNAQRFVTSNAQFIQFDMRCIDQILLEDSMDGVWACASLLHVPKAELPALLNSLWKILKPGGIFYVSVKEGTREKLEIDDRYVSDSENFTDIPPKLCCYYKVDELKKYLKKAGFEIIELSSDNHIYHNKTSSNVTNHPFIHAFVRKQ
jgi:ubiquinone/menaquinone biosynthesis C-methylase UbiE